MERLKLYDDSTILFANEYSTIMTILFPINPYHLLIPIAIGIKTNKKTPF